MDEALKQLSFTSKKGAADVKQTILEAQEMAVQSHNVEFKSNLWVCEYRLCFSIYLRVKSLFYFKFFHNSS